MKRLALAFALSFAALLALLPGTAAAGGRHGVHGFGHGVHGFGVVSSPGSVAVFPRHSFVVVSPSHHAVVVAPHHPFVVAPNFHHSHFVTVSPGFSHHVWVPGFWWWNGGQWAWPPGHWAR